MGMLFIVVPIGLLSLYSTIRQLLMFFFNPKPSVRLSALECLPGGSIDVEWTMKGGSSVLRNLKLVLEGEEEAIYSAGTTRGRIATYLQELSFTKRRTLRKLRKDVLKSKFRRMQFIPSIAGTTRFTGH